MDNNFTEKIERFLAIDNPSDAQVREGALLLLQAAPLRSRGIYNTAMSRPQAMLPWIRTDLRKHLAIRRRGLTSATVEAYNEETVKRVSETLSVAPTAKEVVTASPTVIPVLGTRGKRADHDELPEEIQALWDRNAERWKKMRQYHAQLAAMVAKPDYVACDGNELCYQLRQMDDALRADYRKYDSWTPPTVATGTAEQSGKADGVDVFTDNVKTIQNARTAISRGLTRKEQTEESLRKMQDAVNTLLALGQVLKEETADRLKQIGITVTADAEGN